MVLLATMFGSIAILSSWTAITERLKEYYIFLLILQTGMIGAFVGFPVTIPVPERQYAATAIAAFATQRGVEVAVRPDGQLAHRSELTGNHGGAEAFGQHEATVVGVAFRVCQRGNPRTPPPGPRRGKPGWFSEGKLPIPYCIRARSAYC